MINDIAKQRTKEELIAEQCAAILANGFVVNANSYIARVTFFEVFNDDPNPRTAICMSIPDLARLHKMLGDVLSQVVSIQGKAH